MSESILTHEYLKSILHYSVITGQFYWLKSKGCVKAGEIAGYLRKDGYIHIGINEVQHLAHRSAWFYVTGEFPKNDIDHKNRIKDSNQWLNIREATRSQNNCNRGIQSNNTSGYQGVVWYKPYQKWMARIKVNKKQKTIGYFDDIEGAYAERLKAEKELHGEFARLASFSVNS